MSWETRLSALEGIFGGNVPRSLDALALVARLRQQKEKPLACLVGPWMQEQFLWHREMLGPRGYPVIVFAEGYRQNAAYIHAQVKNSAGVIFFAASLPNQGPHIYEELKQLVDCMLQLHGYTLEDDPQKWASLQQSAA